MRFSSCGRPILALCIALAPLAGSLAAAPQSPYPFAETAQLTVSNAHDGDYLASVDISGDTVVAGALRVNSSAGAAYVFERGVASWASGAETATLTASDGEVGDEFGISVAIDGDVIVVGAMRADVAGNMNQGAAYVFVKPVGGWVDATETVKLTASQGKVAEQFGASVAIDGDTIVVGAERAAVTFPGQGAAYVFVRPPMGWAGATETATLTAADPQNAYLGGAVAVDGDTVVAGARFAGVTLEGAAYVYQKPPTGWVDATETAKLTASDGGINGFFGTAVAIHDDTIAVGAPDANVQGNSDEGAIYLFEKPASGWVSGNEDGKLTVIDGRADDHLGSSVAIHGNVVVGGAYGVSGLVGQCQPVRGAAYLFEKPVSGWGSGNEGAVFTDSLLVSTGQFGVAVSIENDTVVVSDPLAAIGASTQGAAFVFETPYVAQVPPPPAPVLSTIGPTPIEARTLPQQILLTGTGFDICGGSDVTVGGTIVTVVGTTPTSITIQLPFGAAIGSHEVIVRPTTGGSSNALTLDITGSHPGVLVGPGLHQSGSNGSYTLWTDAGWNALYILSGVSGPTALPGIVSFEIGGGLFGNLVGVITLQADASGRADLSFVMPPGLPVPFTLYWESLIYDPSIPLGLQVPLETSNAVGALTLF